METISGRWVGLAAVAPVVWGTTYLTTATWLPPDRPLFAATVRALPAGLLLLAVLRRLPSGIWWWRAGVLGLTNIGMFFPLLFLGAYRLPGGLASTVQALSPLVVMTLAWFVLGERAGRRRVAAGVIGAAGVGLLVLDAGARLDPLGLAGSVASVASSALGFVLVKRWAAPVGMLTLVSWQLVAGGLVLLPVALLVEGAPPTIDVPAAVAFVWLAGVGTVLAYVCWFAAIDRLGAGAVSLVGLLNPLTGTLLGVAVAGEAFGAPQALGGVLVVAGVLAGQRGLLAPVVARLRRLTAPRLPVSRPCVDCPA
jgi:probable blue pigment (indigoidine) exporter